MAKYTCPSCGADFNGKKCRACNYEHFSEEIAHGGHTHQGEPLVIDAPARKPIPRKDPFDCEEKTRKRPFGGTRGEKKKHPIAKFFGILLVIYALLPMISNFGLELEAREEALMVQEAVPEGLVTLYEDEYAMVSVRQEQISDFEGGLQIWVRNLTDRDVYVMDRYTMVNGFVMPGMGVYVDAAAESWGMGTLYMDEQDLRDAQITDIQELKFELEVVDDDSYEVITTTGSIGLSTTGRPVVQESDFDGEVLIDETDLYMERLYYEPDTQDPQFENGSIVFYVENRACKDLVLTTLEATLGGADVDLYLTTDLPAKAKAIVRMPLWDLGVEFDTMAELEAMGDVYMTLELWDPYDYTDCQQFSIATPLVTR